MSETTPQPEPTTTLYESGSGLSDTTMPMVVYVLHLVGLFTGFLAGIVGVVLAYINRGGAQGTWLELHYTYQVSTFWIGILFACIGAVTVPVLIGFLILPAVWVWVGVRAITGMNRLSKRDALAEPETWLW